MNTIFSQLPNDIIMNIIKIETIRKHEQECEDLLIDMIYNFDPGDYDDFYNEEKYNQYGMTDEEFEIYRFNNRDY